MGNLLKSSVLVDIQNLIGRELHEFSHQSRGSEHCGKIGYVFKDNHISELILSTYPYISDKEIIRLPESIGDLEFLEDLKLIDCRELITLPKSIINLRNLKKLDCTGCSALGALPNNISMMENLECLNLTKCFSMKKLPPSLSDLKHLKSLTLTDCQSLISLPENLGDLTSLEVLNLENCRSLKNLPESITNLPNLKVLRLTSCNSIKHLPKDIGNLNKLKDIGLVGCSRLSSIPKSFSELNSIESLDLSYCYSLTTLPDSIGSMKNLKDLTLKGCRELEVLPSTIEKLENLKEIDLYACIKLKTLPKLNFKDLTKLDLSFCDNLSRNYPDELSGVSNLKIISSPIESEQNVIPENMYNLQPSAYDNELSPYRVRQYQERIQMFSHDVSDKITYYLKSGVTPKDAKKMADFSLILKRELIQTNIFTNLDENQDDMHWMSHFKINSDGRVIELHIHQTESIYLTIFPKILCSLKQLEVIRFPNNCIEIIPECITKLKFLRVLDVSNLEGPNPIIPKAMRAFVKGLENYNEFYK